MRRTTIIGAALAYTLWFRGIRELSATDATFLGLLSPLVATALGWLVLDQGLTAAQGLGGLLVLAAITAGQTRQVKRAAAPEAAHQPRGVVQILVFVGLSVIS